MEFRPSHRAQHIKPSPTLSVSNRAEELRAAGLDILNLAAGEPDFDTPEHVKQAAIEAIQRGFTKYTAVDGTPALKAAVVNKFARENQLKFTPDQVLISCGCKHSIYNLMQALINPGDEVIIPAPFWVSYPDMARLAGGEPVTVKTDISTDFKISPDQLRGAISDNTRLLILNSPSNPSGMSYTRAELEGLAAVLVDHPEIVIASDDIYEHIRWREDPFCNILNACPALYNRTVVLNGVSKAYAMTGWRIGYAAGPKSLIQQMKKIQSQSTSNPTSIAQVAATSALNGDQTMVAHQAAIFRERHDFVVARLRELPGVEVAASDGTFYSFPDFSGFIEHATGIDNDLELAEHLLDKARVAVVPGSAFGAPGCIRISYATGMEVLTTAMERIAQSIQGPRD